MDQDFEFRLISVILQGLDHFSFTDVFVLNTQSGLNFPPHFSAHEVELLNHGD